MIKISRCNDLCFEFNQIRPSDRESQEKALKKILGKMGKNIIVNAPFWCDYGYNTSVGDYFFANHNCLFTTAEHALDVEQRNEGLEVALPINIGNNVWIGAGIIVLGGVTIGDNTVIGAGSVVTKSIPSDVIAVGVPCKVLRKITEEDKYRYPMCNG